MDEYTIEVPITEVFGTGIESVEQTQTSTESGGTNEITVTLTNGQQSRFYINNGKDGYSPSITIEQGAEGYSITVTDEEGSHEYSIIVDSTLDAESANPIQNQAVAGAVTQLTSDIAAEVTRATNAETAIRTEASQTYATQTALEAEKQARISAVASVGSAVTSVGNDLRSETSRAQSEEARIEGLTTNTVKYTEQTLNDYQQRQARANIGAGSKDAVDDAMDMVSSLRRAVYDETDRATQAESSIRSDISTFAQTVANKADKDGTYPDMTVGGVMSSDGSTDSTPYLYRVSGGGVEVGNIEADEIVGGTVAWNQFVVNGNFADASGWSSTQGTFSVSGNKATVTVSSPVVSNNLWRNIGVGKASHKYLLSACLTASKASKAAIRYNNVETARIDIPANAKTLIGGVIDYGTTDSVLNVVIYYNLNTALSAGDTCIVESVMAIDLTQMFGSTIADYIYSLEQSSTGAGVAFFRKLFPNDYYEYNTGELMSVEGVSAHVMRDADDNIIGSYPLDSSLTLRGIPKVADGKLYYDGDAYSADGKVTRKYGIVDMGTLTWQKFSVTQGTLFRTAISTSVDNDSTISANAICAKYPTVAQASRTEKTLNSIGHLFDIIDSSYTTEQDFKTAMSGVMLVYELATPTTESAQPYESIQKVSKYGTEEYVSSGIVPVGHVTKYPTDIVSKVNGLPSDFSTLIAPTETGFKATRAYSVNQFIIVNNQLYRVTSAIANGATITVGTNVVATTVADILTSLLNA